MTAKNILIVDDDVDMLEILAVYLSKEDFIVTKALDGYTAILKIEQMQPDLIILDVLMPHLNGFDLCRMIRERTNVPILFFSSKQADEDKILGLSIGGDDFLPKTTSLSVVTAKVQALLRRHEKHSDTTGAKSDSQTMSILSFPGLIIELESAIVRVNGIEIKLAAKEYQMLCVLARNPGRIYSAEQLFEIIWGGESLGDYRTVMVHISNLRKKIENSPEQPKYIETFRGIGYKFNDFLEDENQ